MDSVELFSARAGYFARRRPGYPDDLIQVLGDAGVWNPRLIVADVGAGTGISSELFLRHGNEVWAVEPNAEMRSAAEVLRGQYASFHLLGGSAEKIGLPDASVDLVVAATAFHWFDAAKSRVEMRRILKPGGYAVLIWNERRRTNTPFLQAYEDLMMRFGTDYQDRWGKRRPALGDMAAELMGSNEVHSYRIAHEQYLTQAAFTERVLSASYAPLPGDEKFQPMMEATTALFEEWQKDGTVTMEYETAMYWGRLD